MHCIKIRNFDNSGSTFLETFLSIYFDSLEEIRNNSFIQKKLVERHLQKRTIKCNCKKNDNLYLSVVKNKHDNTYFLRRYDKTKEHKIDCLFYSEVSDYIDYSNKDVVYSTKIFEEPIKINNKDDLTKLPAVESDIKRYTYYAFCQDLISKACTFSFYYKNQNNKKGSLKNFTYKEFKASLFRSIKLTKIKGNMTLEKICLDKYNGIKYTFGVLKEDLTSVLSSNINLNDDDTITVYYNNGNNYFKTTRKRLQISSDRLVNYSNRTKPPYFFFGITKFGFVTRLYLYPIFFNDDYISFVESNYERVYAEYLYKQNITFIKPITNSEFNLVKKEKICNEDEKKFMLTSRPDFIEFIDDKVCVTEVSGYCNQEYKEQLEDKEIDYIELTKKHSYMLYKRVDGLSQKIVKYVGIKKW